MQYIKCLRCLSEAFAVVTEIPLCYTHLLELRAALPVSMEAPTAPPNVSGSVVYYLSRTDTGLIKIGVTQNLHKRVRSLSGSRPVRVLATEPGGYYLERKRHRQFASLRNNGSEWFREAPVLAEHIKALVAEYGAPSCNCTTASKRRRCPVGM